MNVDIVCAVLDGARYLPDFLDSLRAQTHEAWRLWVRDDGSVDGSVAILRAAALEDPRITLLHAGGPASGVARAFGWLLERLPQDAAYVMCADQDDVWLPHKIASMLSTMRSLETECPAGTPVLVHTDLAVVDAELRPVHDSLWELQRMPPEPVTLRRMVVRNVVTGAALMVNRPALDIALPIPDGVRFHDWWLALVVAAFGRVKAVRQATVLYRQHGGNAVGARDRRISIYGLPESLRRVLRSRTRFRADLRATSEQAAVFADRYAHRLAPGDTRFLRAFAGLPQRALMRRKLDLLRMRVLPEDGVLDVLGVLWRG